MEQVSTTVVRSISDQLSMAKKNLLNSTKTLQRVQQSFDKQESDVRTLSEKYSQTWIQFFAQTLHDDKLTWCTKCEKLQKLGTTKAFKVTIEDVSDLFPSSSVCELCPKCLKQFSTKNWYGRYSSFYNKQAKREVQNLLINEHGVYLYLNNRPVEENYQREAYKLYRVPEKVRTAFNKRYNIKLIPH